MNTIGRRLRIQLVGESHGPGIGVLLDGVPPGVPVDESRMQADLDRRRPGTGPLVSARNEPDRVRIQSGVHDHGKGEGPRTTGAPLLLWIDNQDTRSKDYDALARTPRPGHSDLVSRHWSHGHADLRGGGHYSGRLTAPLVAAAALLRPLLDDACIRAGAHLHQVHDLVPSDRHEPPSVQDLHAARDLDLPTAHVDLREAFLQRILDARSDKDSVGAVVAWRAEGVPIAWGDPTFDSIEGLLAHMLFAIPAVKAVGFGAGHQAAHMTGSQHNDPLRMDGDQPVQSSNHAGGILGGRTTGADLWGHVTIKPTSSIFQPQDTIDVEDGIDATLELKGRHDPCIGVRAVPVIQAAVELVLVDLLLLARQEGHA